MGRALMIGAVLALSFRVGDMAFADDDDITGTNVPRDQWRSGHPIIEQFTTMGYQVRGIEGDDNLYEVQAIESQRALGQSLCGCSIGGNPEGTKRRRPKAASGCSVAPLCSSRTSMDGPREPQ